MESVLRGLTIYLGLLVITRFSGRRTMGQMTAFEFVLLLIVAETTQQSLLGDDFSITNAIVLIVTLFTADIVLSYLKGWLPRFALWVDGQPSVLMSDGTIDTHALRRSRVSIEEVLEAAREKHGLARLDQIKSAVLEANGSINIIPAAPHSRRHS
jgi:uncharacterized membrane protein YcaP (DUF421 family)